MLDIKFIRQNPDIVKKAARDKKVSVDIDKLLAFDERRRHVLQELEAKRAEQNNKSKAKPTSGEIEDLKKLKDEIKILEEELGHVESELNTLLMAVPNIPTQDSPVGSDESSNKVIKEVGRIPNFDFKPKEHWELGADLGVIDTETAAKVAGTRFGYIKGDLALMEFALVQLALSVLTDEKKLKKIARSAGLDISLKPFIPVIPPVFVRPDVFQKMARLEPKEERYHIPADDLYLIGSSEHTLGPLHMDHVFEAKDLPVRYAGFSACFRREAGSYGKDTKGIFRVHQFDKVEIESFSAPETSIIEQNFFVAIQELLMSELEIPFRSVQICTGEMAAPDARQIDIEAWMPGQNRFRETHTADLMTDYQARRLGTKFKTAEGLEFVHMNDATVFAIGRTIIAIMENYQTKEGTVLVPKALRKYMGGIKEIKPKRW